MLVATPADFDRAIADLRQLTGPLALDTETTGVHLYARNNPAHMVGIAIGDAEKPGRDFYFAFRHGEGPNLPLEYLAPLRELVSHRTWLGFNIGFDIKVLAKEGFAIPPNVIEVQTEAHLCNENEISYALKEGKEGKKGKAGTPGLSPKYLGVTSADAYKELKEELKARGLKGKGDMWKLPAALVAKYATDDLNLPRRLHHEVFQPELARWGLVRLAAKLNEFVLALTRMMIRGLRIDRDEVLRQIEHIDPRLTKIRERIRELAGFDINPNSHAQLREWLKLPKTNKDFLHEVLERDLREDVRLVLDYRALSKAENTYFRPFLELADESDRLHTNYKAHGTVTGRLSSSEPNLQNASRDQSDRAYSIRKCFVAREGCFLAQFDYSAIEPRIAAHYSGDAVMRQAFLENQDFHSAVARSVFKKADISKEERYNAKTIGLMTIYGGGSHKAARKLGLRHEKRPDGSWAPCHNDVWSFQGDQLVEIPCHLADPEFCTHAGKAFRQKFFDGVPALQPFLRSVVAKAEQFRYVRNPISGRVRRFVGPRARTYSAPNSLIQGTAEHVLREAICELDRKFTGPSDPLMIQTVHDSLAFEIPYGPNAYEQLRTIKSIMEGVVTLSVPVVVDVEIGPSLGNLAKIDLR